ncbi:MAG: hypothetical protein E7235_00030 [Lachnospiraceae bacterium]|nr:hypothetical protein [Lachnospiraceae bacterium]
MKKFLALTVALILMFSLAACGNETSATKENTSAETIADNTEIIEEEIEIAEGWLSTKTGKFYSQFASGKMYMEYETEMEGMTITAISATMGDKVYSESILDGMSTGSTIMEGEDIYIIDHNTKMVIKMSSALNADAQTIAANIVEENDVDLNELIEGKMEIDGKTYDTEEWMIEGAKSIMCFDGNNLKYMVSEMDGMQYIIKVIEISDNVDESLFDIPSDYQMMEM